MRFVSLNEFASMLDPQARGRDATDRYVSQCIAQAKLEQAERHHYEKISLERERIEASAEAARIQAEGAIALETLKHDNELSLANRNHVLGVAAKSSALIDEETMSIFRQGEEWNRTFGATFQSLLLKRADLAFQERLKILDHKQQLQKLTLESNLRMVEVVLAHELQNARLAFEKSCDIAFRLVERTLDLKGEESLRSETVGEWVREAMMQVDPQ